MYIEEFREALAIDETYILDNLKLLYGLELSGRRKDEKPYSDLLDLFEDLTSFGDFFYSPRTLLSDNSKKGNSKYGADMRYAMSDDDLLWSNLYYHVDKAEPKHPLDAEPEEMAVICDFISISPSESTSAFYHTAYYLTVIKWLLCDCAGTDILNFASAIFDETDPMLDLFGNIYNVIISSTKKDLRKQIPNLRNYIKSQIHQIIESKLTTQLEKEIMRIYAQLLMFIQMIEQNISAKEAYSSREPVSYLAYYIAETFLRTEDDASALIGLQFAVQTLSISNPAVLQDAYNTLGILAVNTGIFLQMAYDAYYSWLNRKEFEYSCSRFGPEDEKWRRSINGRRRTAVMRTNFAYVCSSIANTYEIGSDRRIVFQNIAEEQIKKVLPSSPQQMDSFGFRRYGTYGYILLAQGISDPKKTKLGLDQLRNYYLGLSKFGRNKSTDRINVINISIKAIMRILLHSYIQSKSSFDEWNQAEENSEYWKELDLEINKYDYSRFWAWTAPDDRNAYEYERAVREKDRLIDLCDFGQSDKYMDNQTVTDISEILILLRQTAVEIQDRLRRLEYSSTDYFTRDEDKDIDITGVRDNTADIAYYTTLRNATYLFDLLYQDSPAKAPRPQRAEKDSECRNCLTVMNAKYMNDPHEGLTLLDELINGVEHPLLYPEGSSKLFRESVYNDVFVFLKSFTTKIDKLFMWNRYASDYDSDGSNSNGCCIQFDPEMINRIVSYSASDKTLTPIEDDFYLYRMVYISEGKEISDQSNPGISKDVSVLYETLKKLAKELNNKLNELLNDNEGFYNDLKDDVMSSLQQTLQSIMFLFKSDDYAEEDESRLIFVRTPDQQDSIRVLPKDSSNLSRLAINPYKQIYIKKIIFGPNVRNAEEWRPYLQYQLNKIWSKYAAENTYEPIIPNKMYSIENSKIHYRT